MEKLHHRVGIDRALRCVLMMAFAAAALALPGMHGAWASGPNHGGGGDPPLRVWLVGDSITQDTTVRLRLYQALTEAGVAFRFVGSHTADAAPELVTTGQHHHDGHAGWRIADALEAVVGPDRAGAVAPPAGRVGRRDAEPTPAEFRAGWLHNTDGAPPAVGAFDVALMHLGSNDVRFPGRGKGPADEMGRRLEALARAILSHRPGSRLVLARIAPQRRPQRFDRIVVFNEQVRELAERLAAEGHDVGVVDVFERFMRPGWRDEADIAEGMLAPDGLHLSARGAEAMARAYFEAIEKETAERTRATPVAGTHPRLARSSARHPSRVP